MADASAHHKAKVFISYSRDDINFADQLVAALEGTGFDPLIDRHSIPGGEDWKAQLRHMIVEADSIVFVLSPRSAASKLCEWEVEEADQLNKRLIPIVVRVARWRFGAAALGQSKLHLLLCGSEGIELRLRLRACTSGSGA
jgi:TIR domain